MGNSGARTRCGFKDGQKLSGGAQGGAGDGNCIDKLLSWSERDDIQVGKLYVWNLCEAFKNDSHQVVSSGWRFINTY